MLSLCVSFVLTVGVGCSGAADDVASLTTTGRPDSAMKVSAPGQRAVAEEMHACLRADGIPAILEELGDGQLWVNFNFDEPWEMCYFDTTCSSALAAGSSAARAEADQNVIAQLAAKYKDPEGVTPTRPYLIVGAQDHTEAYVRCMADTGYDLPLIAADPGEELQEKQRRTDINNDWANCAREHGFPGIADAPAPVADNWATSPKLLLPLSVGDGVLRSVVEACPPFDKDSRDQGLTDAVAWNDPDIGFDVPGFDGRARVAPETDEAVLSRIEELREILDEPFERYYANLPSDSPLRADSP
jgi:hypothetical protein